MPEKDQNSDKNPAPAPDNVENKNAAPAQSPSGVGVENPAAAGEKAKKGKAPRGGGEKPLIIVADANDFDAEMIGDAAVEEGCEVLTASNMETLSTALMTRHPLLLFVDKDLPDLNLVPLARQAQSRNAALVVQGVFRSPSELISIVKIGAADILSKPLAPQITAQKVVQALAYVKSVLRRNVDLRSGVAGLVGADVADKALKVIAKANDLMSMPHVATTIIGLCGQESTNADSLTKVAAGDPAMSAMMLKRANSAAYGSMAQAASLRDAIVRIGYRTVRSIATLMSVFKMSNAEQKSFGFNRLMHWVHSLAVGSLAEFMAGCAKYPRPEDVFLAGVLHDFGKLVFDDYMHADYGKVFQLSVERNAPVRDMEMEYFKIAHDRVGAELGERWKLPQTICDAVRMHHDDDTIWKESDNPSFALARFVRASDQVSRALLLGSGGDMYGFPLRDEQWSMVGLNDADLREMISTCVSRVGEMAKWLGIPPSKAGITALPPAREQCAWILDGDGKPDRLLDMFFLAQGYGASHGGADAAPEGKPAFIVWDFRETAPSPGSIAAPWKGAADMPVVFLRHAEQDSAGDLPAPPVALNAPLDFMALLQAVAQKKKT